MIIRCEQILYLLLDTATICKKEKIVANHVAHPYNCSKYITCTNGTFLTEDYVYHYENGNVYRPDNGQADFLSNVPCAKINTGKLKSDQHNSN